MQFNINDIIKNGNRLDDNNNPIIRIIEYISMLMNFCWYVGCFCGLMFIILPSDQLAWEFIGAAGLSFVIFFGTMRFLISLIPQDVIDEMREEIYRELDKKLKDKHSEENSSKSDCESEKNDDK